ncbi:MAG: hypothetical protein KF832_03225 [Caldilineaceae bacterium]|nr:hypothetical protein [Caldilineaceae bacterium]
MYSIAYRWVDVTVRLLCQDVGQANRLDQLLQTFFYLTPTTTIKPGTVFTIDVQPENNTRWPYALQKLLWSMENSKVWRSATGVCFQEDNSYLMIDFAQGRAHGILATNFWTKPLAVQRDFFLRSLLMLVRRQAIYGLHANGVMQQEQGLLLIGGSGSGKTTLTLSLVHAGWAYLGDDAVALAQPEDAVTAFTTQRGFACTPETVDLFPSLPDLFSQPLDPIRRKRYIALDAAYQPQLASCMVPRFLLFPTITGEEESQLVAMDETQTMVSLIEQSAGLLIDPQSATQQMTVLTHLIKQARAYRLLLGRDVYVEPAIVSTLLNTLYDGRR